MFLPVDGSTVSPLMKGGRGFIVNQSSNNGTVYGDFLRVILSSDHSKGLINWILVDVDA